MIRDSTFKLHSLLWKLHIWYILIISDLLLTIYIFCILFVFCVLSFIESLNFLLPEKGMSYYLVQGHSSKLWFITFNLKRASFALVKLFCLNFTFSSTRELSLHFYGFHPPGISLEISTFSLLSPTLSISLIWSM